MNCWTKNVGNQSLVSVSDKEIWMVVCNDKKLLQQFSERKDIRSKKIKTLISRKGHQKFFASDNLSHYFAYVRLHWTFKAFCRQNLAKLRTFY